MAHLSYAQRRMWFFDQTNGPSSTYNVARVFHISGPLDRDALAAALTDVVERHDVLRTIYPLIGDDVTQLVVDAGSPENLLHRRSIAGPELAEAMDAEVSRPFDLINDIPIRATLFELENGEHRLLLVFHHIAIDDWSYRLLLRDLTTAYTSRLAGERPPFEPLEMRYSDYVLWQQEILEAAGGGDDEVPAAQLEFWRRHLAGLPEELELPYDRPRPDVAAHVGGTVEVHIDSATHERLVALAAATNSTAFVVCQAALAAWLSFAGAGTDIPLGMAYAGRDDASLEEMVGMFINTLVLRIDLAGDPTFAELVRRTRSTVLDAFDHSTVPFDQVVEAVNPPRSSNRNPLFQVMSNWQEDMGGDGGLRLDGTRVEALQTRNSKAKFDLSVYLVERKNGGVPAGIDVILGYDMGLFDRETAQSMAGWLATVLDEVSTDPGQRLSEIDFLVRAERELVLRMWNDTAAGPATKDLPGLFTDQVRRSPDAVAVESPDDVITYAELNARANRLAHLLIRHGAGPESCVAVVVPRTTALLAMLAVLKAGATFLPIDPDYPADRISYILDDADPALVLTTATPDLDLGDRRPLILDGRDVTAALADCPETDPGASDRPAPLEPDSPAYVVYTSGSTGRPKGVVVTARVLINLLTWQMATMGAAPGTRVSQFSAISFDAFEQEILAALFTGQTVVVPSEDIRRDPNALARWLEQRNINEFLAPDIVVRATLEAATEQNLRLDQLRTVIQGGEPFQLTGHMREFHRQRPAITVFNHYGPSETHVITGVTLPGDPDLWPTVAPIGKPIWNCQTYVLDARLRPLPVGVAGELYLAGAGLARGYIRRPGLTAERFVANPFGAPGERMYRTGDVVRWNRQGELVFVGRTDDQVKINGIRVELGEINSVLRGHPLVAQAATVLRQNSSGDKQLVSYVVPATSARPEPADLRRHAAQLLPAAVVPSAFVAIEALPLNSNGKLDRQALPAPDVSALARAGGRPPRSPMEKALCQIFGEVLGVPSVGADNNFFDMGGHSMLVIRLLKRVHAELGVELNVRTVFEHPTVAALAAAAETMDGPARVALSPAPRPDHVPLSFAQRRLWFIDQLEGPSSQYNLALVKWRITGDLNLDALEAALTDLVARHESLRTVFPDVNGRPFQRILPAEEVTVRLEREQGEPGDLAEWTSQVCRHEFDLANELLVRAEVLSLATDEHAFLLVAHHIVADGWSVAPLCRDLATAYVARTQGRAPEFVPLPVQYADFTLWQHEVLGQEDDPTSVVAEQAAVWQRTLTGVPDVVSLPSGRSRPKTVSARGASADFLVEPALYDRIRSLARTANATPFMVLHAALAALLTRLGAGSDIVLGAAVAGRPDAQLDDLIGCFVNTIVLRTDTSGDPTFRELLARTQDANLLAFQNQDLPFEHLVRMLKPARSRSHHPLFQIMITMQTGGHGSGLPGLDVDELANTTASTSMFDLSIGFAELASGSLHGKIQYATDLFDRSVIDEFTDGLMALLERVVSQPDLPLGATHVAAGR
ncbi:non-ribosomal peptide synthetase [Kutzneria sp. CA-103260]|uniref:non-ribosomal peptide synthetase n=1 Tax=Kutzneria sp. CA-103260 TaxID=2802641 RepID=UPI001BA8C3F5|nr:non-ribosomal peptide synthetase [Kutzneria sp. CA-103260]QUQ67483.1 non-ribosomal peptide synthetase [Kutzneria sp. CA-103260]